MGMGMGMSSETLSRIAGIIQSSEDSNNIPPQFDSKYFHSHLIRGLLRTHRVKRGRLSSLLSVKPPVMVRTRPNPNSPFHNSVLFDVFLAALIKGRLRISIWVDEYILPPSLLPKGNSNFSRVCRKFDWIFNITPLFSAPKTTFRGGVCTCTWEGRTKMRKKNAAKIKLLKIY